MGKKFDDLVKDAKPFKAYAEEVKSRPDVDISSKSTTIGKSKKGGPLEGEIQRAILDWLSLCGIKVWRHNEQGRIIRTAAGPIMGGSRSKGMADIIGIMPLTSKVPGKFLAIEVKRPGGKISAEQKNFIDTIRYHGGVALFATSVDDVRQALSPLFREAENKLPAFV